MTSTRWSWLLVAHNDSVLLTPKRVNHAEPHPAWLTHAITHFRQLIETVNSQLAEQFHVECNKAKSLTGLCARLNAKLAAHTIGLYLNCLLGRPLLQVKDLALI